MNISIIKEFNHIARPIFRNLDVINRVIYKNGYRFGSLADITISIIYYRLCEKL